MITKNALKQGATTRILLACACAALVGIFALALTGCAEETQSKFVGTWESESMSALGMDLTEDGTYMRIVVNKGGKGELSFVDPEEEATDPMEWTEDGNTISVSATAEGETYESQGVLGEDGKLVFDDMFGLGMQVVFVKK